MKWPVSFPVRLLQKLNRGVTVNLCYTFVMDCIFCKIIHKEAAANIIFEDEHSVVISTIEPVSKGHVLVLPKKHYTNVLDIDEGVLGHLAVLSQKIARQQIDHNNADGVNLLHAAGLAAQQSVFHFHIHVVPRYKNDGLDLWFRNSL